MFYCDVKPPKKMFLCEGNNTVSVIATLRLQLSKVNYFDHSFDTTVQCYVLKTSC